MTPQVLAIEEVSRVSPFGMRFWDVSAGAPAQPGLSVTAFPDSATELRSAATWNASGVYSFRGLPGLGPPENGAGDDAYWSSGLPSIPYTVQVSDPQSRYLPFQLSTRLPVRGLFGLFASPPLPVQTPDATWIPLFSSPAREVGSVTAVVRADLQDLSGRAGGVGNGRGTGVGWDAGYGTSRRPRSICRSASVPGTCYRTVRVPFGIAGTEVKRSDLAGGDSGFLDAGRGRSGGYA